MFLFSFFGLDRAQNTIGSLSNPRRRRQRERHQTKGLISITMAVHGRYKSLYISLPFSAKKDLANEDTLLRTHCCRHKCFPVCPTTQHLLRTQILCPGHKKMFLILFRNILCPQQMFPTLCGPRNIMGNNVSSFARAFTFAQSSFCRLFSPLLPSRLSFSFLINILPTLIPD